MAILKWIFHLILVSIPVWDYTERVIHISFHLWDTLGSQPSGDAGNFSLSLLFTLPFFIIYKYKLYFFFWNSSLWKLLTSLRQNSGLTFSYKEKIPRFSLSFMTPQELRWWVSVLCRTSRTRMKPYNCLGELVGNKYRSLWPIPSVLIFPGTSSVRGSTGSGVVAFCFSGGYYCSCSLLLQPATISTNYGVLSI